MKFEERIKMFTSIKIKKEKLILQSLDCKEVK